MACPPVPPIASSRAKRVVEIAYNAPKRYRVGHASVLQSMGSGRRSSRFGHHGRWQRWAKGGYPPRLPTTQIPVCSAPPSSHASDRLLSAIRDPDRVPQSLASVGEQISGLLLGMETYTSEDMDRVIKPTAPSIFYLYGFSCISRCRVRMLGTLG